MCSPTVARIRAFVIVLSVILGVSAEPPIKGPPSLISSKNSQKKNVIEGEDIKLTCPVQGNPEPIVEWSKGDGISRLETWGRIRVTKNWLRIKAITPLDQGMYTCHAVNGFGSVQFTFFVSVVGGFNSILKSTSENLRMEHVSPPSGSAIREVVGNSVQFECQATGNPRPSITWLKDGNAIESHTTPALGNAGKERHFDDKTTETLKLERLAIEDSGFYSCLASNMFAVASANWTLAVLGQSSYSSQTKDVDMRNVTAFVGEDAILICKGTWDSHNIPKIMWLHELTEGKAKKHAPNRTFIFKGQEYEVLEPSEVITVSGSFSSKMKIADVHNGDAGLYMCTISGKIGVKVQRINLTVIEAEVGQSRPIFLISGLAMLALLLIVVGMAASLCKKKGRKRSSDNDGVFLSSNSSRKLHDPSFHGTHPLTSQNLAISPRSHPPASFSHQSSSETSHKASEDASRHGFSSSVLEFPQMAQGSSLYVTPCPFASSSHHQHAQRPYQRMNFL